MTLRETFEEVPALYGRVRPDDMIELAVAYKASP
jgi:hypothetical protein